MSTEKEILMAGYLHELGLTKDELAELLGITLETLNSWESGDRVMSLVGVQLLAAWRKMGHAGVAWRHDAVRASLVYKGDMLND